MIKGQVRTKGSGVIHLQIAGHAGNRDYGFAKDYFVGDIIWNELDAIEEKPLSSLAGTEQNYFPVELEVIDDQKVVIRTNKGAFTINDAELVEYLREEEEIIKKEIDKEELIKEEIETEKIDIKEGVFVNIDADASIVRININKEKVEQLILNFV